MDSSEPSFWERHSFAIRRLHSLSGLVPVGGYMVIHLAVNASVLNSDASFQANVANIHKFGSLLPLLEWTFIFIPILFHAIVGMVIVAGGLPNTHNYPYGANYRYTLQRVTGVIAFFFIGLHVFHMHGWFHNQAWMEYVVGPLGGGKFKPYNATSTAGLALQPITVTAVYLVGRAVVRVPLGQRHLDDGHHLGRVDQPRRAAPGPRRVHGVRRAAGRGEPGRPVRHACSGEHKGEARRGFSEREARMHQACVSTSGDLAA